MTAPTFRRPMGVLIAEQLAADLVRDERDARIEEEERSVREDAILREGAARMLAETFVCDTERLCECGCGHPTLMSKTTSAKWGVVAGQPNHFLHGHRKMAGRLAHSDGYVLVRQPEHPRGDKCGYVLEHILVAEAAIGHFLPPTAHVHHVDGNPANNAPSNLVICPDNAYHMLLHRRQRALDATGDANARKCWICKQYDVPAALNISRRRGSREGQTSAVHPACRVRRAKERRALRPPTLTCDHARMNVAKSISSTFDDHATSYGWCPDCTAHLVVTEHFGAAPWMESRPMTVAELSRYAEAGR